MRPPSFRDPELSSEECVPLSSCKAWSELLADALAGSLSPRLRPTSLSVARLRPAAHQTPSTYSDSTGLERYQLLGLMAGVDVFDEKPIQVDRLATVEDPILVNSQVRPSAAVVFSRCRRRRLLPPSFPPSSLALSPPVAPRCNRVVLVSLGLLKSLAFAACSLHLPKRSRLGCIFARGRDPGSERLDPPCPSHLERARRAIGRHGGRAGSSERLALSA